jgi:RNA polymerase sigma-70 factor (ECF subfamily)
VTDSPLERLRGKGDHAILPNASEPPIAPVERTATTSANAALVMQAFEDHRLQLTSFANSMTRDREAADDIVQEAFLRLVRELNRGVTPDNVLAWLYRVCSNLAVSRGRRLTVSQRFLRIARSNADEAPADVEILRRESSQIVMAGLATLPADARAALLMASQGFSGREIAEAIGKSENATRTMMFRAREKLRIFLVREGVQS